MDALFILKIIIVLFIIIVFAIILKKYITLIKIKRISYYSLDSLSDKPLSFTDRMGKRYYKFFISFRNIFNKSNILKKYASRYDKYIRYKNKNYLKGIDFVINKFIIAIIFLALTFISYIFTYNSFNLFGIFINFIIGFYLLDLYLYFYTKRFNKIISNQILRAVIIMNNSFKAGKSTLQTIKIAADKLPSPINDEFKKMYNDMKFGLSFDSVFDRFAKRVKVPEVVYISSSLKILNSTGGNIIDVFNSIEKTLFDDNKLQEELKNTSGAPKMIVMILIFVPIIFSFIIYILNPNYFDPLFNSTLGNILLVIIILMFICYVILLKKILKVGV